MLNFFKNIINNLNNSKTKFNFLRDKILKYFVKLKN